jgi:hypothetical protein
MLARLHRRLCLRVPPAPLLGPTLVSAGRLDEAAFALARTIDPYIHLDTAPPSHVMTIGADAPGGAWYAGADGQVAIIDRRPIPFRATDRPTLGAALSACLAVQVLMVRSPAPL